MSKKYICPSILAANFRNLEKDIKLSEEGGADIIHCDIMDGQFVPNISFGPEIVNQVSQITDLPLDVHLMINNPENFIDKFAKAGADYISVHYESNNHVNRLVNQIKDAGCKAGVVLNPATPFFMLDELYTIVDFILVMSVNPGFGGQKYIDLTSYKIKHIKNRLSELKAHALIEVDGGIGANNIKLISDCGADMFVCGASIFNSKDIKKTTSELKALIS